MLLVLFGFSFVLPLCSFFFTLDRNDEETIDFCLDQMFYIVEQSDKQKSYSGHPKQYFPHLFLQLFATVSILYFVDSF